MKTPLLYGAVPVVLASLALSGCDWKPSPPLTASGQRADKLALTGDPQEEQLVLNVEAGRANYKYRLEVIRGYYQRIGNIDKYHWAQEELDNLASAQFFSWEGLKAQITPPAGESVERADEVLLAEYVGGARAAYTDATATLLKHYEQKGESFKARMIVTMRARLFPERMHTYYINADIPGPTLRPTEVIPEAERLYERAVKLYEEGKILPAVTNYNKERQALTLFLELVRKHRTSTRIALSAYYIGEIYKEYFNGDWLAVHWYERAWQWDPAISRDARFQAAVVWDHRLHNRAKALELYREVLKHEQFVRSNVGYAERRIEELTSKP
jgi:hypothetical protein